MLCLSPAYLTDTACCIELCAAVGEGLDCVPVCVDKTEWAGLPYPPSHYVPETLQTDGGEIRPRDALTAIINHGASAACVKRGPSRASKARPSQS